MSFNYLIFLKTLSKVKFKERKNLTPFKSGTGSSDKRFLKKETRKTVINNHLIINIRATGYDPRKTLTGYGAYP